MHGEGPVRTGGRVAAVVLAGGAGTRFGAPVSKVYVPLGDRAILAHPLQVLQDSRVVEDVVVVIREGDRAACDAAVSSAAAEKVRAVVTGGATRQGSEAAGLRAVPDDCDTILVHDGARPFLTLALLQDLVDTVRRTGGGAIPGVGLTGDLVTREGVPVPTRDLVAVQTPQAFPIAPLRAAFERAAGTGSHGVDTAQTVQAHTDLVVRWVPGDSRNLKVTHPEDLAAAERLLPRWAMGRWR